LAKVPPPDDIKEGGFALAMMALLMSGRLPSGQAAHICDIALQQSCLKETSTDENCRAQTFTK
jgi:hypothetical protein